MKTKSKLYTVKEAKDILSQFPDGAEARGFQNVRIAQKPVAVKQPQQ